jgi:hypothetical protein
MEKYTYKVVVTPLGETIILRSDGATIPTDERNADYQVYLDSESPKNVAE